ncbi:phosphotransferase [Novosphingobium sp.]|uniref:phosphotransferase n=1 Tax=Novosphingobium sp. TaxID=1874826 RepID=UPI00260D3AAE|nr:phosphotransferase [Novosphingobium sp.]
MGLELPADLAGITPEWLTALLAEREPGLVVDSVGIVDVQHGACSKVRLAARTNRNDFPSTVMMKAGFEPHSFAMRQMHVNEYHAYADLVPTVSLNAPKCYGAVRDEEGRALVVLEDLCLRDVRFLTLQKPISFDLAKRFIEGLARFHARWWNAPDLDTRFGWAPDTSEEGVGFYFHLLTTPEHFARYATSPRGAAMPKVLLDPERIRAAHIAMTAAQKAEGMAMVVNHGDMHLGNLYLDADGTPGFLDMQPRRGAWSIDVSYFLIAGLDLVDRRRWEGALLQHYLQCLTEAEVSAPSFDAAWAAYRRDVVWGLLIWMLNSSQFQTEANNTAAATRFAMAMLDHDTFGVLGV